MARLITISSISVVPESECPIPFGVSESTATSLVDGYPEPPSAIPITANGCRKCSNGERLVCVWETSEVDISNRTFPLGNARGENISESKLA
jgi:hypothetical protein